MECVCVCVGKERGWRGGRIRREAERWRRIMLRTAFFHSCYVPIESGKTQLKTWWRRRRGEGGRGGRGGGRGGGRRGGRRGERGGRKGREGGGWVGRFSLLVCLCTREMHRETSIVHRFFLLPIFILISFGTLFVHLVQRPEALRNQMYWTMCGRHQV